MADIAKKMLLVVCGFLPVIISGGAAYYFAVSRDFDLLSYAIGTALGVAANAVKVVLLDRSVKKTLTLDAAHAPNYARLQALLRFVITAAAPLLCALIPFISNAGLYGAIFAVATYHLAAYSTKLFIKNDQ
ncbi:MAG: hypothetical protein FWG82_05670 [Oscillospiraceae bacterium]|nr:hypothetical protein [Oscillospiraceae bacterium]